MVSKRSFAAVLMIFIGAIIATTFIASIATQVNLETNQFTIHNDTVTVPSTANTTLDLTGRELVTAIGIWNATESILNNASIMGSNGTDLQTGWTSGGLRTVQLITNDTAVNTGFIGKTVNVSYIYLPDGYVSDSGARSVTTLITLISALAIVVYIIVIIYGEQLLELLGRLKR
jgi:hypothetical protein